MKPCHEIESLFLAYHEGLLPEQDRRRVDRHVLGCTACARKLQQLSVLWETEPPAISVPPGFSVRVLAKVKQRRTFAVGEFLNRLVLPVLKPAAVGLMIVASVLTGRWLAERGTAGDGRSDTSSFEQSELYALEVLDVDSQWSLMGVYLSLGEQ